MITGQEKGHEKGNFIEFLDFYAGRTTPDFYVFFIHI